MLPTCAVTCTVFDQSGNPDVGAIVKAKLSYYDVYEEGFVAPEEIVGIADDSGKCVLELWPNELGLISKPSYYSITIVSSSGKTLRTSAVVPNVLEAELHQIAELQTFEGKTEGQLLLEAAVQAAGDAASRAESSAIEATLALQSTQDIYESVKSASISFNPTHLVIPADVEGVVDFTDSIGKSAQVSVIRGSEDETALWDLGISATGVSATFDSVTKILTVIGFASETDTGYVDVTASRLGYSPLVQRLSVVKVRQGEAGASGVNYSISIESTNGDIFKPGQETATLLIAHVFRNGVEITDELSAAQFKWRRVSYYPQEPPYDDATWNALYTAGYKQIEVTTEVVQDRATFHCDVLVDTV